MLNTTLMLSPLTFDRAGLRFTSSPLQVAVLSSLRSPMRPWQSFVGVSAAIVLAALLRSLLALGHAPWLLFMPVVLVASLLVGRWAGTYAVSLSAAASALLAHTAAQSHWLTLAQGAGTAGILGVGGALVWLGTELRLTVGALAEAAEASRENTTRDSRRIAAEAPAREAFFSRVLASTTDRIELLTLDGRLAFASRDGKWEEQEGASTGHGRLWPRSWLKSETAWDAVAEARAGRTAGFVGQDAAPQDAVRWWDVVVTPVRGASGALEHILCVARDITVGRQMEQQQALLNGELSHQLRNVLSIVQGIAGQTLRQASSLGAANEALSARLVALGRATDVLTASSWAAAEVERLLHSVLVPFGGDGPRFHIHGPVVRLDAQRALALAFPPMEVVIASSMVELTPEQLPERCSFVRKPFDPYRLVWNLREANR